MLTIRKNGKPVPWKIQFILILVLFFLGLILLCTSIRSYSEIRKMSDRCTLEVSADCIRVDTSKIATRVGRSHEMSYPVFSYEVNGQIYEKKSYISISSDDEFRKGEKYTIKVDPNDPDVFIFDAAKRAMKTRAEKVLYIGAIVMIISAFMGIREYKKKTVSEITDSFQG